MKKTCVLDKEEKRPYITSNLAGRESASCSKTRQKLNERHPFCKTGNLHWCRPQDNRAQSSVRILRKS